MKRHIRVGELPYSFFGGGSKMNDEQRTLYRQLQANNDHMMSELRNLAKHLNEVEEAILQLTQLVQSTQRS